MTIQQEFNEAVTEYKAEQESFKPLIEKFEELKEVLKSNFKTKRKHRKWYGAVAWEILSTINIELEEKFIHNNTKYLYIRINGVGYVMGLGEVGDLKDKLYFLPRSAYLNNKHVQETVVYTTHQMFGAYYHILEHKQTTVQLFSHFIRTYRDYLVG